MREAVNKPNSSKKAILFCNPNGVFIQFFGYDNEYIRNYLKLVYITVVRDSMSFCGTIEGMGSLREHQL